MVDFISEVEEELRKDDYNKFLRRYGPAIIGLLVAVVAVVAFIEWRDYADNRTARAAAASYLDADQLLNEGQTEQARAAFLSLADVAPDGYAGLSLMRAASLSVEEGNAPEAVRLYDAASDRFSRDRHVHLAQLKAAYILSDLGQWSDVETRVSDLIETDAPYEFLARELLATAALNQGDIERAREHFTYLSTVPGVPPTVAERATQALTIIPSSASPATPDEAVVLPAPENDVPALENDAIAGEPDE